MHNRTQRYTTSQSPAEPIARTKLGELMNPRKWRKDGVRSKNGTSWRLMTGRDTEREWISLGLMTEEQAQLCLDTMQREENETAGTPAEGRIQRLAGETDGKARVVRYLQGAPLAELAPELGDRGALRLDAYVAEVWGPVRAAASAATWKREEWLWKSYILPPLGPVRVKDLDHVRFDEFINAVVKQNGQPASWNTKRLVRAAYQGALTHAERKGHIPSVHRFYELKGSGTVLAKPQPLSTPEIHAIIKAAKSTTYRALFAFAFEQGARPGEINRVHWEDIGWPAAKPAPYGRIAIRGTKTDASKRTIPLLALTRQHLEALWIERGRPDVGVVFLTDRGQPFSDRGWKRSLKTAAENAGITDRRIFPYLGRHTALTAALDAGASKDEAAALAGHTNPRMLGATYDHGEVVDRINVHNFPKRTIG